MAVYTSKRLFTVSEFEQMDQAGIFRKDDRLELIDGEIFAMAPIGSRHAACVRRLQRLFTQALGERVLVDVQNPIVLHDRSEPLPDVVCSSHGLICMLQATHGQAMCSWWWKWRIRPWRMIRTLKFLPTLAVIFQRRGWWICSQPRCTFIAYHLPPDTTT